MSIKKNEYSNKKTQGREADHCENQNMNGEKNEQVNKERTNSTGPLSTAPPALELRQVASWSLDQMDLVTCQTCPTSKETHLLCAL